MKTPSWFLKKNFTALALLPVSWIYFLVSRLVYISRPFCKKTSKRPVICIGNILAGGVGKTPIVREVAKRLKSPVIMRGYGGLGTGDWGLVKNEDTVQIVGDEAKMLKNANVDVYVGDRRRNIDTLNQSPIPNPQSPIIMDDGFQNPTIKKDISILVFDGKIGVGNSFLLPAGPLREPLSAIKRADAILVMGTGDWGLGAIDHLKKYKKPVFLVKNKTIMPNKKSPIPNPQSHFIAFAGIGYPQKFFENLPKRPVKTISFPDHHQYSDADLQKIIKKAGDLDIITTEKDWVRLPGWAQKRIRFAPLKTTIQPAFYEWLRRELGHRAA